MGRMEDGVNLILLAENHQFSEKMHESCYFIAIKSFISLKLTFLHSPSMLTFGLNDSIIVGNFTGSDGFLIKIEIERFTASLVGLILKKYFFLFTCIEKLY